MIEVIKPERELVLPKHMEDGETGEIVTGSPINLGIIVLKRSKILIALNKKGYWDNLDVLSFKVERKNYELKEIQ